MERIAEDIYCLDLGAANAYLCRDEDGLTLIDTGMPGKQAAIFSAIAELGGQPTDLVRIMITHGDIDHAGSLAAVQKESGATVYAGEATATYLTTGRSPEHLPALMQAILKAFVRYKPVPAEAIHILSDGDVLPVAGGLQALHAPGHTMDHFAFYSPTTGVLFAGDAMETRTGQLQRSPRRITANVEANNQSAIRMLNLSPAVYACGHGVPLADHASDDLLSLFAQIQHEMGE